VPEAFMPGNRGETVNQATEAPDNREKVGFRPLFREPVPKLTEFWNWLDYSKFKLACQASKRFYEF
jgi:hypothetical protein